MKDYLVQYSIYASEEILTYKSVWKCLAKSLAEAKQIVFKKLKQRYPLCRIAV